MKKTIWLLSALCTLAAIALCAAFYLLHAQPHSSSSPARATVCSDIARDCSDTLFPDLNSMHVTALSISTPERSFQFIMDKQGMVSVNGQQADGEIFSTLLDQIAELPVERHSAFSPQPQDLILTLVVSTDQQKQTVRFYEGGSEDKQTHIILGPENAPEYRQTSVWRVGTLMMTCEGTRIQDIHGNETPAIQ